VDLSEEEAQEQLTRRLARLEARSEEIAEPVLRLFNIAINVRSEGFGQPNLHATDQTLLRTPHGESCPGKPQLCRRADWPPKPVLTQREKPGHTPPQPNLAMDSFVIPGFEAFAKPPTSAADLSGWVPSMHDVQKKTTGPAKNKKKKKKAIASVEGMSPEELDVFQEDHNRRGVVYIR
jgi:hypothetical protein